MQQSLFDPLAYTSILGSTFAKQDHQPLVVIGVRTWTKWQLGRIGCPHPAAAVRIQRVIKTLDITSTSEFIRRASEFGKFQDVGVTCYAVVLALVRDLGGDVLAAHGDDRSFDSVHSRALKIRREKPDAPNGKAPRLRKRGAE